MSTIALTAEAYDEGTRIEVLDPHLSPIPSDHNLRTVSLKVEPGVYAVRFTRGMAVTEKVVLVSADSGPVHVRLEESEEPLTTTAAPLVYSNESDDAQRAAAERISSSVAAKLGKAATNAGELLIFVRTEDRDASRRPDVGLSLHDVYGEALIRFDERAETMPAEGWSGLLLSLSPGAYRLRREVADETLVEQMLYVCTGWQTQVFAQAVFSEGNSRYASYARMAVHMASIGHGFDASAREVGNTETALRALRERSSIPGSISEEMLHGKFTNPMLGILAGLLQLRRADLKVESLKKIVSNLIVLVGPIPDVVALGLAMMNRDERFRNDVAFVEALELPGSLENPPYFNESWRHICDATSASPELMPPQTLASVVSESADRSTAWLRWQSGASDVPAPAARALTQPFRFNGDGLGARLGNALAKAFGVTNGTLEDLSLATLSLLLAALQKTLTELEGAAIELQTAEYTDVQRRIASFVYPLGDPLLRMIVERGGKNGQETRTAVLARGRDGRAMSKALQLPLGTALTEVWKLQARLYQSVSWLVSAPQIEAFALRESRGNGALKRALLDLREVRLPLRLSADAPVLDALQYLSLRYRAADTNGYPQVAKLLKSATTCFVDENGTVVKNQDLGKALRLAQTELRKRITAAVKEGTVEFESAKGAEWIASLRKYSSRRLFAPLKGEAVGVAADEADLQAGGEAE